ncbi:MAG: toxin-antitoxin system YwqK family antitoxin [Balneolaceae bacterium]|nr:MAG: toxin-antitoxin system YwqK family antitoxin [Balneolaceae bacterium]
MRYLLITITFLLLISCSQDVQYSMQDHITSTIPNIKISDELHLYTDLEGNPVTGHFAVNHKNGELRADLTFEDGMIVDGMLFTSDGRQHASYSRENGSIINRIYHKDGSNNLKSVYGSNLNDRPYFYAWFENGELMVESTPDLNRTWHRNGQLATKSTTVEGKMEGVATTWHENGVKAGEGYYKDDKPHGMLRNWDEDGNLISERKYDLGMPHGIQRTWDGLGNLIEEKMYENGKPHGAHKAWDSDGNLIEERLFEDGELVTSR